MVFRSRFTAGDRVFILHNGEMLDTTISRITISNTQMMPTVHVKADSKICTERLESSVFKSEDELIEVQRKIFEKGTTATQIYNTERNDFVEHKTKFDVGDEVYTMDKDSIIKTKINRVYVTTSNVGSNNTFRPYYFIDRVDVDAIPENKIFRTPTELFESLRTSVKVIK